VAQMVLVADDSPTIQKKAQGILKGEGFEVETVSNGVAAIKRIAVIQPVVVLADVSMPGRDGYEVCEFVKKSAEFSHVPVLLVASDMEPYDENRGAQVRADGKIKKPFEPQELISMVTKFAAQAAAVRPESEPSQITAPYPAVSPESASEFALAREEAPVEEPPQAPQPAVPDFSAFSEGMPFAEPTAQEPPAYSPEPFPAEWPPPLPPPLEPTERLDTVPDFIGVPPAPEQAVAPEVEIPAPIQQPPAEPPEPLFIEEKTLPLPKPSSFRVESSTLIFRAPAEIAEPVWRDETLPAPPGSVPASTTAPEPASEPETPVVTAQAPAEQPRSPHVQTPAVAATSLDSFSLDAAAAGQVRFTRHGPEPRPTVLAEPAPAEAPAPIPAPAAALDWATIYAIVQKVAVRVFPPSLPAEAIEGMARKITEEIASEFGVAPPQTPS